MQSESRNDRKRELFGLPGSAKTGGSTINSYCRPFLETITEQFVLLG